jgi:hypothetical protein
VYQKSVEFLSYDTECVMLDIDQIPHCTKYIH